MSKDARRKLRDMGGIMASSPDLIQAVQKFQVGGPLMGPPPSAPVGPNFSPRMPPAPLPGIRPAMPSFVASDRPLPAANPPRATRLGGRTFLLTDDNRVIDAETNSPAPAALANEVRRKLGAADVVPEYREAGPLTFGGGASPNPSIPEIPFERRVPKGIEGGKDEQRFVTREPQSSAQMREEPFPLLLTQGVEEPTVDNLLDISALGGIAMGTFNRSLDRGREIRRTDGPTSNEAPPPDGGGGTPDAPLSPEETVMAQPLVPENISDETLDRMRKLLESDPNVSPPPPGGGGDGAGGTPTKKDLRSLYKEQLGLFKEIYGTNDEDEARDRAMSLAMIGLAIAAGQSPNALTNIAQGTMVGLQAMGDRREAGRERERGMKTLALQTAIDQMSAATEADADAARMEQEQANKIELEREKARLNGGGSGGGGGFKYEPPPLVAETFYKTKNDLATAAREDPSIVPEQYGENVDGWADLQARRSSKDYLRTLLPQLPEGDRESAMRSGQQLLYPDPSGTGLRIVQNPSDLDFILPDQEFVFLDRSVDPPTYVRQKKVVDPETGRFKAVAVE